MKIFNSLSETEREQAIHFIQHDVIANVLEDGLEFEAQSDEEKENKKALETALLDVKNLPEDQQTDACFEDDAIWDFSFQIALDIAQNSLYIEDGETHYHLGQIKAAFEDEHEATEASLEEAKHEAAIEKEIADVIQFPVKKGSNVLN